MVLDLIPVEAVPVLFGAAGGAVLGILTYVDRKVEGECFEGWKFVKSLLPAVLVGFASGVFTPDYKTAFAAGLVGKKLWETFSKVAE